MIDMMHESVISIIAVQNVSGITFSTITSGKMAQLPKKQAWAFEMIVS